MDYYVYVLLNPNKPGIFKFGNFTFDYEPFYVGKGIGSRMYSHACPSRIKNTRTKKNAILRGLNNMNKKPIYIKLYTNLDELDSFSKEIEVISLIGRSDLDKGPLTNLSDGGEGPSGNKLSDDTKKKISSSLKNKPKSEEHNKKVSNALKNKPKSEDHKNKTSAGLKKYYLDNIHSSSIRVMNCETGEIFESANKAARSINGNPTHILSVCRGERNRHKKIKWKFA
jgi:hypothetical protein